METVPFERRKARTNNASRAIGLLFAATASAYRLELVALADARGLLLVQHGDAQQCDLLAAYGPLVIRAVDPGTRAQLMMTLAAVVPATANGRLSVRRLTVHGEDLYLCVVGDTGATKEVGLGSAAAGARRILA